MNKIYFLDLETTGLDPQKDRILEIAIAELQFSATGDSFWLDHFYDRAFRDTCENMNEFVTKMHRKSGLIKDCKISPISVNSARKTIPELLEDTSLLPSDEKLILGGSSIHFDMNFLRVHMPELANRFSHRMLDVSAVKLFCQTMGMPEIPKFEAHRAKHDICESFLHLKKCQAWLASHYQVKFELQSLLTGKTT